MEIISPPRQAACKRLLWVLWISKTNGKKVCQEANKICHFDPVTFSPIPYVSLAEPISYIAN